MRSHDFLNEDWQKANKSDKTDGMSQKAVNAYRRENPGSKLKTAVTTEPSKLKKGSKDSKRRKSFCARSNGQKQMHNIDCSKDPDKAICAARRRWNCESLEQELAEAALGIEPKRPARAGSRPGRGHGAEPRYKSAPVVLGGDNPDAKHPEVERGDQVLVQDPDNIATVFSGVVKRIGREHVYVTLKNGETIAAAYDEVSKDYDTLSKRAHKILNKKGKYVGNYSVTETPKLSSREKMLRGLKRGGYDVEERSKFWDEKVKEIEAQIAAYDAEHKKKDTAQGVAEECAGVGIVTKQNSTADVGPGTIKKNLKAFNLTDNIDEGTLTTDVAHALKRYGEHVNNPLYKELGKMFSLGKLADALLMIKGLNSEDRIRATKIISKAGGLLGSRLTTETHDNDEYVQQLTSEFIRRAKLGRRYTSAETILGLLDRFFKKFGISDQYFDDVFHRAVRTTDHEAGILEMETSLEEWKASRQLCRSSTPDADLGASALASCKSQGLRARDGNKSHKLGKGPESRVKVGGHKLKGKKYGGKLPDWS